MLKKEQTAFSFRVSKKILSLSIFYLVSVLAFIILVLTKMLTDNLTKFKISRINENYYTQYFNINDWDSIISASLMSLGLLFGLVSFFVFLLDKNPYHFSTKIKNNKWSQALILGFIDIYKILIGTLGFFFLVTLIFKDNPYVVPAWYRPDLKRTMIENADPIKTFFSYRNTYLTNESYLINGTIFLSLIIFACLLSYVKASVFSRKTRILGALPFASLIANLIKNNKKQNIVEIRFNPIVNPL
ncbi:hypothetical protein [Mycoplasma bradburyae]|uniref:hypothetical protein n=1 Tax=Mycoplasma bradburyae TaxID=2963128 RepID=UPI002340038C|nr:hypothetical protein [Mycoplasma bradburyae]MDC4182966.1 hypothetical protein [Mycoplasma bradburyae]